ncbi:MAG: hypothetical protein U0Q03_09255 [Acidimicrobiales bacterium]
MILSTIHLAAWAGGEGDPWKVLGNSGFERLAIAGLADLALARRLAVAPAADDESPGARRLSLVPGPPVGGITAVVEQTLAGVTKQLDVDRAVRALRDLGPQVDAALVASGDLVPQGQHGMFKKREAYAAQPERGAAAQSWIRMPGLPLTAAGRAMVLIAVLGLPNDRMIRLTGGPLAPELAPVSPWVEFDPGLQAPDGAPIGPMTARLLDALVEVLAGTSDTTGWLQQ